MKGFSKDLVLGWTAQTIHSKKIVICSNSLDYMIKENCHLFEQLMLAFKTILLSATLLLQITEPFAMNLSKTVSLNDSSKHCLPSPHEFSPYIFCWIAFFAFITFDYHYKFHSRLSYNIQQISQTTWSFHMKIWNAFGSYGNTLSLSTNFASSKYHQLPLPFLGK